MSLSQWFFLLNIFSSICDTLQEMEHFWSALRRTHQWNKQIKYLNVGIFYEEINAIKIYNYRLISNSSLQNPDTAGAEIEQKNQSFNKGWAVKHEITNHRQLHSQTSRSTRTADNNSGWQQKIESLLFKISIWTPDSSRFADLVLHFLGCKSTEIGNFIFAIIDLESGLKFPPEETLQIKLIQNLYLKAEQHFL